MIVPDGGALPEPVMLEREPDPDSCLCPPLWRSCPVDGTVGVQGEHVETTSFFYLTTRGAVR